MKRCRGADQMLGARFSLGDVMSNLILDDRFANIRATIGAAGHFVTARFNESAHAHTLIFPSVRGLLNRWLFSKQSNTSIS